MVPSEQRESLRSLITNTLTLLCKNGLTFSREFGVEALIGITVDTQDTFLVSMKEVVRKVEEGDSEAQEAKEAQDIVLLAAQKAALRGEADLTKSSPGESDDEAPRGKAGRRRKKRRRSEESDGVKVKKEEGEENSEEGDDRPPDDSQDPAQSSSQYELGQEDGEEFWEAADLEDPENDLGLMKRRKAARESLDDLEPPSVDRSPRVPGRRTRRELNLAYKIKLIQDYSRKPRPTLKKLSQRYGIGVSTVSDILRRKQEYITQYDSRTDANKKRFETESRIDALNACLWSWYEQERLKETNLKDEFIQDNAIRIAQNMGLVTFMAPKSWLDNWKSSFLV